MPNILVTGFEPFGEWSVNPTEVAVNELHGQKFGNFSVIGKVLPLRYAEIKPTLLSLVEEYQPQAVALTGQAGGSAIRLEKIARNKAESRIPYNCGTVTHGESLEPEGPEELKSALPLELMYQVLTDANIPVTYSEDAGLFGCNQTFYQTRYSLPQLPAGFIHVPLLPQQAKEAKPSMEQVTITKAIFLSVKTLATFLEGNK